MNPIIQLMLAISVVGSNSLALSPIASTVATSFAGVSATDVMLASALFGLGTAADALVLAPSADRLGLKTALRYSLLLLLTGFVLSATAPALWVLCLGQSIAGIASGVALPCTYGLAAEIAPEGNLSIGILSSSIQTVLWLCFVWGALNHLALNLLVAKLSAINPQRRAAIMGLYSATTYVSMFLGTLLFKSVFDSLGFSTLGFLAALFILPVAAVSLQAMRHNKKEAPSE